MDEILQKAKHAKSVEELKEIAKENDIEVSDQLAQLYFNQINKTGELSDDELDSVAGGGCNSSQDTTKHINAPLVDCCANFAPKENRSSHKRCCADCAYSVKRTTHGGMQCHYSDFFDGLDIEIV